MAHKMKKKCFGAVKLTNEFQLIPYFTFCKVHLTSGDPGFQKGEGCPFSRVFFLRERKREVLIFPKNTLRAHFYRATIYKSTPLGITRKLWELHMKGGGVPLRPKV